MKEYAGNEVDTLTLADNPKWPVFRFQIWRSTKEFLFALEFAKHQADF